MSIDRAATLRSAEKLLRQGKLDQAIAEYLRVVEDQPRDWNTANILGDLFVRAGKTDKAIEQYVAAADSLSDEGTLAKAAALYRKILKLRPEHEHALLQCAEVAATQGVLVDARNYLKAVAERRQARGDQRGVAQITIRLASLDPNDFAARRAGARARLEVKDLAGAVRDLREIAVELMHQHRDVEAIDALREAVTLSPDDHDVRQQLLDAFVAAGDHVSAREHARTSEQLQMLAGRLDERGDREQAMELLREALAIDPGNVRLQARVNGEVEAEPEPVAEAPEVAAEENPATLLELAGTYLRDGHIGHALAAIRRVVRQHPDLRTDVALLGLTFTDDQPDLAFAVLDIAGDASIAEGDHATAAAGMQELVTRVPLYLPALMRLVEICVDGGLEATMHAAQAQLCDAYIESGAADEARFLAEDLVAREPWERANLERFRQALELMGETDPDGVIASRLSGESPFTSTDVSISAVREAIPEPEPPPPAPAMQWEIDNHGEIHFETTAYDSPNAQSYAGNRDEADEEGQDEEQDPDEVDLSLDLDADDPEPATEAPAAPAPPAGLEAVFSQLRDDGARRMALAEAQEEYVRAVSLHAVGRVDESIPLLESASKTPQLRFGTASLLGRIFRDRGQLDLAVEWLERASQAPPSSPDEGRLLMYDLADVLETTGEHTRALTVCMELQADAGDFRDVADRVNRLSVIQTRG